MGPATLYTEPGPTWDTLLSDIASARQEVLLENYILLDGVAAEALLQALRQAQQQGAAIRIHVDGAGSYEMSDQLRQQLAAIGTLRIYHPLRWRSLFFEFRSRFMQRTHRRFILIDQCIGWTGGMAIEDPWWKESEQPFRDTMIRLQGQVVVQMRTTFFTLWEQKPSLHPKRQRPVQPNQIRVIPHRARRLSCFRKTLLHRIGRAQNRAWMATAYFIPPRRLRRALIRAAQRGVDVRLLLPGPHLHDHPSVRFASRRYYAQLLRHGVKIYEYQPSFQHAKTFLFDQDYCMVGTPNLDRWSFLWNHEVAVDMHHAGIYQQLQNDFEKGFQQSLAITLQGWKSRPLWSRFLEYFFGIFDRAF